VAVEPTCVPRTMFNCCVSQIEGLATLQSASLIVHNRFRHMHMLQPAPPGYQITLRRATHQRDIASAVDMGCQHGYVYMNLEIHQVSSSTQAAPRCCYRTAPALRRHVAMGAGYVGSDASGVHTRRYYISSGLPAVACLAAWQWACRHDSQRSYTSQPHHT
jgi:hypothetical protein